MTPSLPALLVLLALMALGCLLLALGARAERRQQQGGATPVDTGLGAGRPPGMPTEGPTGGAGQARGC